MRASRVLLLVACVFAALLAFACVAEAQVPERSTLNPTSPWLPYQKPIGPQYISGNIVYALLVGLMLLFVTYTGVSCLMSVERPVRLSAVPLQLAKEY